MDGISYIRIPVELFKLPFKGIYEMSIFALVYGFGNKGFRQSNDDIARILSTSSRTVERAVCRLRKQGLIANKDDRKTPRCLIVPADIMSGQDTDIMPDKIPTSRGNATDMTVPTSQPVAPDIMSVRLPTSRGGTTDMTAGQDPTSEGVAPDMTADHKYIREEEEEYRDFFGLWNSRKNLPPVRSVIAHRKEKLSARMKEKLFADNWRQIIDKVSASDFCTGSNDRGWKADIDWLLKNSHNYAKVLEGKYDNRTQASASKLFTPQQEQAFLDAHTYLPTESEAEQLMRKAGLL